MANFSDSDAYRSWGVEEIRAYSASKRWDQINASIALLTIKCVAPVGLVTNLTFLYVVARVKSMRSIVNIYLTNLAVVDTAFHAMTLVVLTDHWEVTPVESATFAHLIGSYCFVTALAFERFSAVRHPLTYRTTATKGRAILISAALWLVTIFTGIGYGVTIEMDLPLLPLLFTTVFTPPVVLINVILFVGIIRKMHNKDTSGSTAPPRHCRREIRVTFVLFLNHTVFFSSSILIIIQNIYSLVLNLSDTSWLDYFKVQASIASIQMACYILVSINSAINPLVYSWVSADFRSACSAAFCCQGLARPCGEHRHRRSRTVEHIEMDIIRNKQNQPRQ
ncbi:somatostatin receptor type 4-like [Acanthaster planci]|uniref:Somatostatin receptor type 4-like n=1 Tax=Acanthaster planci TaxID=133434 RepID=A0A8B7ZRJ6_ACAPL|nr:somatostatin receptor type 4-like [Acanthaster planci]